MCVFKLWPSFIIIYAHGWSESVINLFIEYE